MIIGIMPNFEIENVQKTAEILKSKLIDSGMAVLLVNGKSKEIPNMIISIGGDGTYLHTMRYAIEEGVPVLGMNMGRLGFLTQFDFEGIDRAVSLIKNNEYTIEERCIEDIKVYRNGENVFHDLAFNDLVIYRNKMKMLDLEIHVDDSYVTSVYGDGLIVATPTGSTAYSLSAGGPIIEPESEVLALTPICPHSVNSRPMVISDKKNIRICLKETRASVQQRSASISTDGTESFNIAGKDEIIIRKSELRAKVVKLYQTDFYKILREKFL